MNRRHLAGYSGARLAVLTAADGTAFVRKTALHPKASARLRRQMDKQAYFLRQPDLPFGVPRILAHGERDGGFYFDMELVDGEDAHTFLATRDAAAVAAVQEQLVATLGYLARHAPAAVPASGYFDELVLRVLAIARGQLGVPDRTIVTILLGLDQLRQTLGPRSTLCHGDFSLENLLVDRSGRLVCIDFLDSPFEHFWQDVSKLHLDLEMQWYARHHRPVSQWVLCALRERVGAFMREFDPHYFPFHSTLLAVNLLRILPYTQTEADRTLILGKIQLCLPASP
jgi:aminoglycoside phosphotransferase